MTGRRGFGATGRVGAAALGGSELDVSCAPATCRSPLTAAAMESYAGVMVPENGTASNVFSSTDAPATTETTDPTDYELGMRFTANAAGTITELRYFRGAADANDTDTRVLNLWNAAGVLLGSVTVTSTAGESGWQVGTLSAPIAIQAGATYVVVLRHHAELRRHRQLLRHRPQRTRRRADRRRLQRRLRRRHARRLPDQPPTTPRTTGPTSPSSPPTTARRSSPRPRHLTSPENRSLVTHHHRDRRQRQPAHLRDRRRGRRRALHHRRPDRPAALCQQPELRGPGRRGRQQRLRPDRQRQRRHRAGRDPGDHRHRHRPGRERHRLDRLRPRPTRRRRPRQPTRPTTSSA